MFWVRQKERPEGSWLQLLTKSWSLMRRICSTAALHQREDHQLLIHTRQQSLTQSLRKYRVSQVMTGAFYCSATRIRWRQCFKASILAFPVAFRWIQLSTSRI